MADRPRRGDVTRPEPTRITVPGAGIDLGAIAVSATEPAGIAVLMIHENRGLVPYMLEVARALGEAGHPVVAPDLLSRIGGTESFAHDPTSVSTRQIDQDVHEADLLAVYDWMADRHADLAVVGFCFGGEMGWRLITHRIPDRAVLYYGIGPSPDAARRIRSRVYAVYAQDDPRVNDTLPPLCEVVRESSAEIVAESYPGTRHAFHDHTRPDRHHPQAAAQVWRRTLDFLGVAFSTGAQSPGRP
jgi:carboxymethylenebutenolidase